MALAAIPLFQSLSNGFADFLRAMRVAAGDCSETLGRGSMQTLLLGLIAIPSAASLFNYANCCIIQKFRES